MSAIIPVMPLRLVEKGGFVPDKQPPTPLAWAIAVREDRNDAIINGDISPGFTSMDKIPLVKNLQLIAVARTVDLYLPAPRTTPTTQEFNVLVVAQIGGMKFEDGITSDKHRVEAVTLAVHAPPEKAMAGMTEAAIGARLFPPIAPDATELTRLAPDAEALADEIGIDPADVYLHEQMFAELIRRTYPMDTYAENGLNAITRHSADVFIACEAHMYRAEEIMRGRDRAAIDKNVRDVVNDNEFREDRQTYASEERTRLRKQFGEHLKAIWGSDTNNLLTTTRKRLEWKID